jgi:hypothetical protein
MRPSGRRHDARIATSTHTNFNPSRSHQPHTPTPANYDLGPDLVANSKHFGHKHLSSSSNGYSLGTTMSGATALSLRDTQGNYLSPGALNRLPSHHKPPAEAGLAGGGGSSCPVHLLQADELCGKCGGAVGAPPGRWPTDADEQQAYRMGSGHALGSSSLADNLDQQLGRAANQARLAAAEKDLPPGLGGGSAGGLLRHVSCSEQMHFIESHIADLHNRQATSSVKELSSLGEFIGLAYKCLVWP